MLEHTRMRQGAVSGGGLSDELCAFRDRFLRLEFLEARHKRRHMGMEVFPDHGNGRSELFHKLARRPRQPNSLKLVGLRCAHELFHV